MAIDISARVSHISIYSRKMQDLRVNNITEVKARSHSRRQDFKVAHSAFNSGVTLLNPITDASDRQVLFSNQLLPMEENLRKILKHYDKYGFGKGFEITKPKRQGEFSGPIQLENIHKSNSPLKRGKGIFESPEEDNTPLTDIKENLKKSRNVDNRLNITRGFTSPTKPPLPNKRKQKILESISSNSSQSDIDVDQIWNYNSESPFKTPDDNLAHKRKYPPSLLRLKTAMKLAKESPGTQSLNMSRSPLKLQDIEDAKSRISHSPDSAIKLNTSSK